MAIVAGCGDGEERERAPPLAEGDGGVFKLDPPAAEGSGCAPGETRPCDVVLGEHEGVVTCYSGVQVCQDDGRWSPCGGGHVEARKAAAHPDDEPGDAGTAAIPFSLSEPQGCQSPCDPTCQAYVEVPDGGLAIQGSPTAPWNVAGDLQLAANSTLAAKGLGEPCASGADCQIAERCERPVTGAACAHDKCAPGAPLAPGCDPTCVDRICQQAPQCCLGGAPACAHDLCVTGAPLGGCADPCVTKVCAARPSCCTSSGAWDAACVGLVPAQCAPKTCPVWSPTCVNLVHDVCDAYCDPPPGACAHDPCLTGAPLAPGCGDACVDKICLNYPTCCDPVSGRWDALCAAAVGFVCGQACADQGTCAPWLPAEVDPACPSYDLVADLPCLAGGESNVAICNVGTASSPAGVQVEWFPTNVVSLDPNVQQNDPSALCAPKNGGVVCADPATGAPLTVGSIAPGRCVDFRCKNLGNGNPNGSYEVRVNPPGPAQKAAECACMNNWTVTTTAACEAPSCAGEIAVSPMKRPVMMFMLDRSAAVSAADFGSIKNALAAFWPQPSQSGVVAAVGFYPDTVPGACDTLHCASTTNCGPRAAFGPLPSNGSNLTTLGLNAAGAPAGGAPTSAAIAGSITALAAFEASQSAVQRARDAPVLVLFLGSDPAYCTTGPSSLCGQAAAALVKGIRTFVIGVGGVSWSTIDAIAMAGGGKAYPVGTGASVQSKVQAALDDIRRSTYACTFDLPPQGQFDPANPAPTATLLLMGSPPASIPIPFLTDPSQCGAGGFHYAGLVNGFPTQIDLCPETCDAYAATIGNTLSFTLGCPAIYAPSAVHEDYAGLCPPGTTTSWGYLFYDTLTPPGTSVDFQVRTGPTSGSLGPPVVVATAAPGSSPVCQPPTCFVDLYQALGLPAANQPALALDLQLVPNAAHTLTPRVQSWEITYSCLDSE